MSPTDSGSAVRALARTSRVLERVLTEPSVSLTLAQYRVLAALAAGDERASRIARRLMLGRPSISATVDALRQRGLVDRSSIDTDQRAAALSLTDGGRAVLGTAQEALQTCLCSLVDRTPDPGAVLRSLGWLDAALDAHVAERTAVGAG